MTPALASILATVLLAIAGYAQYRIAFHTAPSRVALTRGLLALVAAAFGFGVVHIPAAIILLVKHLQGAGRS
jgi:hypothetical protein